MVLKDQTRVHTFNQPQGQLPVLLQDEIGQDGNPFHSHLVIEPRDLSDLLKKRAAAFVAGGFHALLKVHFGVVEEEGDKLPFEALASEI